MKYWLSGLILLLCCLAFAQTHYGAEDKPVIVASTTQIADFARQVAGDRAVVKSIMAPGADPHTYQPTPNDVQIVLGADLCLENGLNLEGKNWMATLAKDANKPIVTVTDGTYTLEAVFGGGVGGPDGHVVVEAEPHRGVRGRVVPRRPHAAECVFHLSGHDQVDAHHH